MFISKKKLEILLLNERMNVQEEYKKLEEERRINIRFDNVWQAIEQLQEKIEIIVSKESN